MPNPSESSYHIGDMPNPSESSYHTRQTDRPGYDPRQDRRVDPTLWDWEAAFGQAKLRGRGLMGGIAVVGLLVIASNVYLAWRSETVITKALASSAVEHRAIVASGDQMTCILAMTPEERLKFRDDTRPDAWSRWCWWLRRPPELPPY